MDQTLWSELENTALGLMIMRKKGEKEGRAFANLISLHGKCSPGTCHLAACLCGGNARS